MDINLAVLAGRLAAPGEHRTFESGAEYLRVLVTVRSSEPRRRVDVVPVTLWDPGPAVIEECRAPGARLWVAGALQRRFWAAGEARKSRLELVAHHIEVQDNDSGDSDVDIG